MKIYLKIILFIGLYLFNEQVFCQEIVRYTKSDGLADNFVTAFLQDSKGYMWIGTWDGLSRFDGNSFETYINDPNDTTTIFADQVNKIVEDKLGNIWVLTRQGLVKYNSIKNNFQRIYFPTVNLNTKKFQMRDLIFDENNTAWCIFWDNLFTFNNNNISSFREIDISALSQNYVKIITTNKGLWLSSKIGILFYSFDVLYNSNTLTISKSSKQIKYPIHNYENCYINNFIKTYTGSFFLLNSNDNILFAKQNDEYFQKIEIPKTETGDKIKNLGYLQEINKSEIWIFTYNNGIIIYNYKSGNYIYNSKIQNLLAYQRIVRVYEDNQNNIWIGAQNGAVKYSLPSLKHKSWIFDGTKKNSLKGITIRAVFKDKNNNLWIGSQNNGLEKVNLETNRIEFIEVPNNLKHLLNEYNVYSITNLNDDEILIAYENCILRLNTKTGLFYKFRTVEGRVNKIFKDKHQRLWIVDDCSLIIAEKNTNTHNFSQISQFDFLPRYGIWDIDEDRNGQIWITSSTCLVKFDEKNPKQSKLFIAKATEIDPNYLFLDIIDENNFNIGTLRYGMFTFNPKTEVFSNHFSEVNGLIDNTVNSIFEHNKYLWISTEKGISKLNIQNNSILNYSKTQGLPILEFNASAYFKDDDNTIYLGGEGAVVSFNPDSFVVANNNFPLYIDDIKIANEHFEHDFPLKKADELIFKNDENLLTISFSCLDFRHSDQRIYRYRLNGLSNSWTRVPKNQNFVALPYLAHGEYDFELESTYIDWPWIRENTGFKIIIQDKPLIQKSSFHVFILVSFVITLLLLLILKMKNSNIKKKAEISMLEKDANISTLNFLKSQMNPHFYFNTLNAINGFILENNIKDANKFLTTFARLMREILDNSQKDFITVEKEVMSLQKYLDLQQLRYGDKYIYEITGFEEIKNKKIPPMLIQPFVENTIEHAFDRTITKGLLKIEFQYNNSQLICRISDNGIGFIKSRKIKNKDNHKSTAIKNIYNRIEVLNNIYKFNITIEITENMPNKKDFPGTLVILIIPDSKNNR